MAPNPSVIALCDLADAVLAAPVVALTPEQRARWGVCPACEAPHGMWCYPAEHGGEPHSIRLAAAPTHARLVAVEGGE